MADGYYIYNGNGKKMYRIAKVKAGKASKIRYSKKVPYTGSKPYYTVKAYAYRNGKICYSGCDKSFRLNARKYSDNKILFIGNSITFGTPYTAVGNSKNPYYSGGSDRYAFSYPRRVSRITGAKITNVSVAGSTYTYLDSKAYPRGGQYCSNTSGQRCLTITRNQMANAGNGRNSYRQYAGSGNYEEAVESLNHGSGGVLKGTVDSDFRGKNPGRYSDYDVIVLSAGTNDAYFCNSLHKGIGTLSLSNTDNTNFTGAVNRILSYIENANKSRVSAGKPPIRVVFVDLFYRRDIKDGPRMVKTYQNRINAIIQMWSRKWGGKDPKIYRFSHNYLTAKNIRTLSSDYLHLTRASQGEFGSRLANYLINKGILK